MTDLMEAANRFFWAVGLLATLVTVIILLAALMAWIETRDEQRMDADWVERYVDQQRRGAS